MNYLKLSFLFLVLTFSGIAQQRTSGIKMLLKDKITGNNILDSAIVTFNDSIRINAVPDAAGYYYFPLSPNKYIIRADRRGYYSQILSGVIVGESKTAYVTIELGKPELKKTKKKKRRKK